MGNKRGSRVQGGCTIVWRLGDRNACFGDFGLYRKIMDEMGAKNGAVRL